MEVGSTYRAVQAVSRGRLELTEKTLHAPGPGKVRIRVEACGVCHSDSGTVEALFPLEWPRVPGHEVVGRIDGLARLQLRVSRNSGSIQSSRMKPDVTTERTSS
jgi:D-arabinose 1-dehydrogenase-like Zn-dependent alcohol dehydrogenase